MGRVDRQFFFGLSAYVLVVALALGWLVEPSLGFVTAIIGMAANVAGSVWR